MLAEAGAGKGRAGSVGAMVSPPVPRTLADQLRGWSDERLATLLRERPDLVSPTPHDSSQLASRAAVRSSLLRAMDGLTHLELAVLDALVVLGPCDQGRLEQAVHAAPGAAAAALCRLQDLALVWAAPDGLRPLTGVADGFAGGVGASGLRPCTPGAEAESVAPRLELLSPAARALLEHLDRHGGQGTSSARTPASPEEATTPAEELLALGLVQARPGGTVVLPGEVGLALRGGRTTREPVDEVPELATSPRSPELVDRAAAGAAFETVRRVELLLDHWGSQPPPALRSGGLGVRDLKAAARMLHAEESVAALLVETATAAGLLTTGVAAGGEAGWLPTDAYDSWVSLDTADRWARLAEAWLDSPRLPALVGTRERSASRTWNALVPEMSSLFAVESRRMALTELAGLPPGQVLATGTGPPSLVTRVVWRRPRRPSTRADMVAWSLTEAAALGLSALGGLATAGRLLLAGDASAAARSLAPLLPDPVHHVLLQADLTAVAPGPLAADLARRMHLVADVESRGGATVHRFTPASVRRAFDAGWSAGIVHEFLASVSRTEVPQPLTYLVDDVARTFGTLRVGHAESFLRSDDETALAELLHHPRAASLGLRRLAPTVVVSALPLDVLLPRLRELGAAPVVEAADGTVRVARPDLLRARTPRQRRPPALDEAREAAHLAAVVHAVRVGDRAAAARPAPAVGSPADALTALREAVESGRTVWIGYVDGHGSVTERIVDPLSVEGGQLHAWDHRGEDRRTFAVHRITGVRPVDP